MTEDRFTIRSYARIFKPERRIYAVEGHRLPVPGGVPLSWLAYALGTLLLALVVSGGSWAVAALIGMAAGLGGVAIGGRGFGLAAALAAVGTVQIAGVVLGWLDWPLRFLVLPGLVATVATQATPDGRPAHRYALSWLGLRARPKRRSLGRDLPEPGRARDRRATVWVAPDQHEWHLGRARITGPAKVQFASPLVVGERRRRGGKRQVVCPPGRFARRGALATDHVELASGEVLELR